MSPICVYLCYHSDMLLSDYEYVHQCLKFGTDVHVTMVKLADANQTFTYKVRNHLLKCYYRNQHHFTISLLAKKSLKIILVVLRIILRQFLSK